MKWNLLETALILSGISISDNAYSGSTEVRQRYIKSAVDSLRVQRNLKGVGKSIPANAADLGEDFATSYALAEANESLIEELGTRDAARKIATNTIETTVQEALDEVTQERTDEGKTSDLVDHEPNLDAENIPKDETDGIDWNQVGVSEEDKTELSPEAQAKIDESKKILVDAVASKEGLDNKELPEHLKPKEETEPESTESTNEEFPSELNTNETETESTNEEENDGMIISYENEDENKENEETANNEEEKVDEIRGDTFVEENKEGKSLSEALGSN